MYYEAGGGLCPWWNRHPAGCGIIYAVQGCNCSTADETSVKGGDAHMRKYVFLTVALAVFLTSISVASFSPVFAGSGFSDVPADYWAAKYINKLAQAGYVTGVGGGKYDPEGKLTRAQMAVIAVRLAGINADKYANAAPKFSDVQDKSKWYYKWVYAALQTGIIKGYPDGTFKPNRPLTRAELIVIAERLYKLVNGVDLEAYINKYIKGKPYFPAFRSADEPEYKNHWAKYYATLAILPRFQLINWREPGRLIALDDPATRAEMAYSIYKVVYPVKTGGTLKVVLEQEPDTLFGKIGNMWTTTQILAPTGYGSVASNWRGDLWPDLGLYVPSIENGKWVAAKSMDKPLMTITLADGSKRKIYMITTYELKPGTKWADGAEVTIDDAIFSILLTLTPGMRVVSTWPTQDIARIEKIGKYGMKVYWTEIHPYAGYGLPEGLEPLHWFEKNVFKQKIQIPDVCDFMLKVTDDGDYIAEESVLINKSLTDFLASKADEIQSSSYNEKPLGNGAYQVDQWIKGQSISLVPNKYSWIGPGLFNKVVYVFKSPEQTFNELRGKKVDVAIGAINAKVAQALGNERTFKQNYNMIDMASTAWEHWTVNFDDPKNIPENPTYDTPYNHPLFKYKLVRQALSYALDRQEVIDRVYYGKRQVCHSFIVPGTWAYWPELAKLVKYDPAKVEPLLQKAGFTKNADGIWVSPEGNKFEFTAVTTTRSDRKESLEIFSNQLKKYGIIMHPETQTARTLFGETIWVRDFDVVEFAWVSSSVLEPGGRFLYHSSMIAPNGGNLSGFRNKDMDKAINDAYQNLDRKTRKEAYIRMQKIWADWLPEIPLSWYDTHDAVIKNLEGFDMGFDVGAHTWNMEYWYKE